MLFGTCLYLIKQYNKDMNKKTYILGIIAIAVVAGIVWYGNNNQVGDQMSSALDSIQGDSESNIQETTEDLFVGSPDAPVTIIEYSSHFCSHCIDFHEDTLPLLMEKYIKTGQVKLISRFVSPVEIGMAIFCANEQDKFSEFSDYVFEHAQELESADKLKTMAGALELNQDDFNQCFDDRKYEDRVEEWFDQATQAGVEGTPTFFINGQKIVGHQPLSVFEEVIEQALGE